MFRCCILTMILLFFGTQHFLSAQECLPDSTLEPGKKIFSTDGRYHLVFQGDGNLVWLQGNNVLWNSGTAGAEDATCHMQADGNLVIYANGERNAVFSTNTYGNQGARLVCQSDGNLVVYNGSVALWDSLSVMCANAAAGGGIPEVVKAGGAVVVGAGVGWGFVAYSGFTAVGAIGSGAGVGATAGPVGAIVGGVVGLASYGIYRLIWG